MSSSNGDLVSKAGSPLETVTSASLSQPSDTIVASQNSLPSNTPSSLPTTVMGSQDAAVQPPGESMGNETAQDSMSQPPSNLFSQVTSQSVDTDSSMMPPPTPSSSITAFNSNAVASRSSGRAIKPTLKARDNSEEPLSNRWLGSSSLGEQFGGSQGYGFRSRRSTQNSSINGKAPRLKLNLKGGHASRGKGDPTLAGVNKTLPYMQGYDRELDSSDDEEGEGMAFEEQIILRMPEGHEATRTLGEWVRRREVGNEGREVEVKFKDSRRAVFKMRDRQFSSKLVDLPAIIESHKTLDNKQMFKIADISQMLLVSHQVEEESEVTRGSGGGGAGEQVEGLTDDFVYDHGITPPMKWARKRRFRKRIHKRTIETVEKEVERLLAEDERADNVEYTMIDLAEADLSDSDEGGGGPGEGEGGSVASPTASMAGVPFSAPDGASVMSDLEDEFSQMGEGETSGMGGEDEGVDQDLQRELEEEMLLQQQEEDDEDEDEDESSIGGRNRLRGRSMSRATSDDEDDDDEEDEDDLFDAGGDDEGAAGATEGEGKEREEEEEEEDEDDDDLDEEEQERRVRETQLEAECKEIEAMVKRKHAEVDGTNNALIKQRNLQTLKRMQTELDMKKSQLIDLKQQRREGKEAAKAEAEAQAKAQEAAAAAAAEVAEASAAPPTPLLSSAPTRAPSSAAPATAPNSTTMAQDGAVPSAPSAAGEREKVAGASTAKGGSKAMPSLANSANEMDVDEEAQEAQEEEDDEEEEDEEEGSDTSDLFG